MHSPLTSHFVGTWKLSPINLWQLPCQPLRVRIWQQPKPIRLFRFVSISPPRNDSFLLIYLQHVQEIFVTTTLVEIITSWLVLLPPPVIDYHYNILFNILDLPLARNIGFQFVFRFLGMEKWEGEEEEEEEKRIHCFWKCLHKLIHIVITNLAIPCFCMIAWLGFILCLACSWLLSCITYPILFESDVIHTFLREWEYRKGRLGFCLFGWYDSLIRAIDIHIYIHIVQHR